MEKESPKNNGKQTLEIIINGVRIKDMKEFMNLDIRNEKVFPRNAKNEKSISQIKDLHQVDKDPKNFKNIKDVKYSKYIKDSKEYREIKESGKSIRKVVYEEKEEINITSMDDQNKNSLSNVSKNKIWAMLHEERSMNSDDFDYPLSYEVDYNAKLL